MSRKVRDRQGIGIDGAGDWQSGDLLLQVVHELRLRGRLLQRHILPLETHLCLTQLDVRLSTIQFAWSDTR